jgi:uncharacterized damage-inducible protein DinB/ketosteroid isomerase-like protein
MTPEAAAWRWADTWRSAWERRDTGAILALYAEDTAVVTGPFRETLDLAGQRAYVTRVFGEEEDPHVAVGDPIVDGDRAAVAWWASLREGGADMTLVGTSLLRFDRSGLVIEQWDTWNALPERRDPPPRWAPTDAAATDTTATDPQPWTPSAFSPVWADDTRTPPPTVGDDRELLCAHLDWHRATTEHKCSGVPVEALSRRTVAPSGLSLHGLVRHLAAVERWWFRMQFAGEDLPPLYYTDDAPDSDFDDLDGDPAEAFSTWRAECERSRQIVAAASLDDTCIRRSTGERMSLRAILLHVLTEYARHNGQADLLRERIDGATGA